jgi:hypothetical protein
VQRYPQTPRQQNAGHRARARRSGVAAGCALTVVLLAGCGDVNFVPSPYTPQHVELIYSAQEHITIVRWRVDATVPVAQTRFELLGSNGSYSPIDFSQSVFAGGVAACTDNQGSCAQYVVRGNYSFGPGARPVQAVHDVYGVLPGGVAAMESVPETISFKSFFRPGNDIVYLNITDVVAKQSPYSFPRPFERAMWATGGLCVSDLAPSDVSFSPLDNTGGFPPPQPLTDQGTYCVGTRPIPADHGDSTLIETRIATLPEVVTGSKAFIPPVERAPIIYQIVLDLEIPVPDRCTDAIQRIEDLVQRYMGSTGTPAHKLPTINLSGDPAYPCAQTNDRVIDSAAIAQAIKQFVTTQSEFHQQVQLMYFNNLDAPLPSALRNSFEDLLNAFLISPPGYELRLFSWLFAPLSVAVFTTPMLNWWAYWVWQTPDMNFEMKMADYAQRSLPYTSQEHLASDPVPLLTDDEVAAYDTDQIRICSSSSPIQPHALLPTPHDIFAPSFPITVADPPTYLVTTNNQVVVDSSKFVQAEVDVDYQICTRYCDDHPFVDTAGEGQLSWVDSPRCASESF